MPGTRRAITGVVAAVAVALTALLALRGGAGGHAPVGTADSLRARPGGSSPGTRDGSRPLAAPDLTVPPVAPGHGAARRGAARHGAEPHASPLSGAGAYLAGRSGAVLAAVYDVQTGQSWRLGGGAAQDEASVVKLNVLQALLARHGGGLLDPADQVLARSMVEDSDNDAATSLWRKAGGAAGIAAYNDKAGLTGTTPSQCVTCAGFAWPGWGLTTTVPQDQLTLLKQLVVPGGHPLLSPAQRSYVLSLMENVAAGQAWGVSGGVPPGVTVALKNGWLPLNSASTDWQVNSVGWVSGDGRDYLVAVLATGNPTERYGIDTVSHLSALIWSAMRLA